jgi:hypothetical protein
MKPLQTPKQYPPKIHEFKFKSLDIFEIVINNRKLPKR